MLGLYKDREFDLSAIFLFLGKSLILWGIKGDSRDSNPSAVVNYVIAWLIPWNQRHGRVEGKIKSWRDVMLSILGMSFANLLANSANFRLYGSFKVQRGRNGELGSPNLSGPVNPVRVWSTTCILIPKYSKTREFVKLVMGGPKPRSHRASSTMGRIERERKEIHLNMGTVRMKGIHEGVGGNSGCTPQTWNHDSIMVFHME